MKNYKITKDTRISNLVQSVPVPLYIDLKNDLTLTEKKLYSAIDLIQTFKYKYMSYQLLEHWSGLCERSIIRNIKSLMDKKLIQKKRIQARNGISYRYSTLITQDMIDIIVENDLKLNDVKKKDFIKVCKRQCRELGVKLNLEKLCKKYSTTKKEEDEEKQNDISELEKLICELKDMITVTDHIDNKEQLTELLSSLKLSGKGVTESQGNHCQRVRETSNLSDYESPTESQRNHRQRGRETPDRESDRDQKEDQYKRSKNSLDFFNKKSVLPENSQANFLHPVNDPITDLIRLSDVGKKNLKKKTRDHVINEKEKSSAKKEKVDARKIFYKAPTLEEAVVEHDDEEINPEFATSEELQKLKPTKRAQPKPKPSRKRKPSGTEYASRPSERWEYRAWEAKSTASWTGRDLVGYWICRYKALAGSESHEFEIGGCDSKYNIKCSKNAATFVRRYFENDYLKARNAIDLILERGIEKKVLKTFAYYFTPKSDEAMRKMVYEYGNTGFNRNYGKKEIVLDGSIQYDGSESNISEINDAHQEIHLRDRGEPDEYFGMTFDEYMKLKEEREISDG